MNENRYEGSELESVIPSEPGKARKRIKNPENWKKNKKKRELYSPHNKKPMISCVHSNNFCKASSISNEIVKVAFNNFYSTSDKVKQDSMISSLLTVQNPKKKK